MDQMPRAVLLCRIFSLSESPVVVGGQPFFDIRGLADIDPAAYVVLYDVNPEGQGWLQNKRSPPSLAGFFVIGSPGETLSKTFSPITSGFY